MKSEMAMRSTELKLSVIVPTYNRAELLGETLKSLSRQSLPVSQFEVIVVDDGSTDQTPQVVDGFRDALHILYVFQEDLGFRLATARNLGIAASSAPTCVFIDCGVVIGTDTLKQHVALHAQEDLIAVLGYTFGFSQDDDHAEDMAALVEGSDAEVAIKKVSENGRYSDVREKIYAAVDDDISRLPAPWAIFWGCHTSVSRSLLLDVGIYDNNFQSWGGEDDDLAYRLQKAGARFHLSREAKSLHLPHGKEADTNRASGLENLEYMYGKYRDEVIRSRIALGWDGVNEVK
jgi:glycosyltransferase involved in cell wall biosynthesis